MMKNFGIFLLFLSFGLTSCSEKNAPAEAPPKTPETSNSESITNGIARSELKILNVKNQAIPIQKKITGRVQARNNTALFSEVQGILLPGDIDFRKGISFKKGDVLIRIEKKEFEYQLQAQKSQLLDALSGILPDLKSDYPESFPNWSAYASNYEAQKPIPEMPKPANDQEKFFLSTYQIYSQYYAIKALEERLKKYEIRAPYSGSFILTNIDLGSLVSPGQALGTISSTYAFELEAGIDLALSSKLKAGDRIEFYNQAINKSFSGTLTRKTKIVDPATQNLNVYFRLSGSGLSAGMYLTGNITTQSSAQGVLIPAQAYQRDGTVLHVSNNQIQSKAVEALEYLTDSLVVAGLSDGDQIILNQFQTPVIGKNVSN